MLVVVSWILAFDVIPSAIGWGMERAARGLHPHRDVFQLLWSRNAVGSTWERREWEYALSLARPFFIRPT